AGERDGFALRANPRVVGRARFDGYGAARTQARAGFHARIDIRVRRRVDDVERASDDADHRRFAVGPGTPRHGVVSGPQSIVEGGPGRGQRIESHCVPVVHGTDRDAAVRVDHRVRTDVGVQLGADLHVDEAGAEYGAADADCQHAAVAVHVAD